MKNEKMTLTKVLVFGFALTAALFFGGSITHATESEEVPEPTEETEVTMSVPLAEAERLDIFGGAQEEQRIKHSEKPSVIVTMDHKTMLLSVGGQAQLNAAASTRNGEAPASVEWTSSNPAVIRVSKTGRITAVSPGAASVYVTAGDGNESATAKCAILVYPEGDLNALADSESNWTIKALYKAIADLQTRISPWNKVLCIGDSVTAGVQAGEGKKEWIPNYPLTMETILETPAYNHGVGGSSIWSEGNYSIIDSLDEYENADAVFLMGGYNDWFYGVQCPIGDLDTPGTFTYDFNALCERINELYPDAEVYVILPPTPHDHMGIEPYYDFSWLKGVEKEIAASHGYYILDLPQQNIMNGLEDDTWNLFFSDNVHPNDYGYLALGTIVTDMALQARER